MAQYKRPLGKTTLHVDASYEGERIEQKIQRIVNNGEPITDGAPLIYTDRKDGVQADYDPRADKWDAAIEAMGVVAKTNQAKRQMGIGERTYDTMSPEQQEAFNKQFPENKHAKAKGEAQGGNQNG